MDTAIQFIGTSPKELIQMFKEEIIPQLKGELSTEFQPKKPEEYLTRAETAALLKKNISTIHRWQKNGILKAYSIEGTIYFKRSEIETLFDSCELI